MAIVKPEARSCHNVNEIRCFGRSFTASLGERRLLFLTREGAALFTSRLPLRLSSFTVYSPRVVNE